MHTSSYLFSSWFGFFFFLEISRFVEDWGFSLFEDTSLDSLGFVLVRSLFTTAAYNQNSGGQLTTAVVPAPSSSSPAPHFIFHSPSAYVFRLDKHTAAESERPQRERAHNNERTTNATATSATTERRPTTNTTTTTSTHHTTG